MAELRRLLHDDDSSDGSETNGAADDDGPAKLFSGHHQAGPEFQEDIYDAVAVAAFGGMFFEVSTGFIRVHPLWTLILAIVLFHFQQAVLLYLCLDQDLDRPVHGQGADDDKDDAVKQVLLLAKLCMICAMSLALVPELLDAFRLLLFSVNPTNWTYIRTADPGHHKFFRCIWSSCFVGPIAIISQSMKFLIAYMVQLYSVSIILACSSVEDCMFNALALLFIVELDNQFLTTVQRVFHFKFDIQNVKFSPTKAGVIEFLLTSLVFIWMYWQVFFSVFYSLKTDTLPMARDVCFLWELTQGTSWLGGLVRNILRFMSLEGKPNTILNHLCNPRYGGYCNERFHRMTPHDMYDLILETPSSAIISMSIFATIVLIPQIFQLVWVLLQRQNGPQTCCDMAIDGCLQGLEETTSESLRMRMHKLEQELQEVKLQMATAKLP
eukprot:Skav204434  [mRNA]  locus=scaffold1093:159148:160461:+ [translate_table: standard]